jgi:aspartyl-tRNA(Asn)/glutamyl-tRNA(Gln) amidotransferase subunit B
MLGEVLAALNSTRQTIAHFTVRPADLAALLRMIRDGVVSRTAAKQIFSRMVATGDPPAAIAEREGLRQITDDAALAAWVDQVLAEHPNEAMRFLAGESRLIGVLVGQVMKKSKGSADPKRVNQMLAERAGK